MGRYDLSDRTLYDGRPTQSKAKSPRNATRPVSNAGITPAGSPRTSASRLATDQTSGHGGMNDTNANRRNGARIGTYYRPKAADLAGRDMMRPATTRVSATAPARINGTRLLPGQRKQQLANAEFEGFRQRAMTDHNLRIGLGCVRVETTWVRSRDSEDLKQTRLIPVVTPFWSDDPQDSEG